MSALSFDSYVDMVMCDLTLDNLVDEDDKIMLDGFDEVDVAKEFFSNDIKDNFSTTVFPTNTSAFLVHSPLSLIVLLLIWTFLFSGIDASAIRREEWVRVELTTNQLRVNLCIKDLKYSTCHHNTPFQKHELKELKE